MSSPKTSAGTRRFGEGHRFTRAISALIAQRLQPLRYICCIWTPLSAADQAATPTILVPSTRAGTAAERSACTVAKNPVLSTEGAAEAERPPYSALRGPKARACLLAALVLLTLPAAALLPPWLQHTVTGTALESALFRAMALPGVSVLFPRPPAESITELNHLTPTPELLQLRAKQEEAALDLAAAERDLKVSLAQAPTNRAAGLALADFYHRRLAVDPEFTTLLDLGSTPPTPNQAFQSPLAQTSWQAFERALRLATNQSLPPTTFDTLWQRWLARYPDQPTLYARAFTWNLNHQRPSKAQHILDRYKTAFPTDAIFPVKASALLALQQGGPDAQTRALAVYNSAFQPLWPPELLNSYFDLLAATHNTRRFVADAQARLQANPEDLNPAARLFLFFRHDGHPETASSILSTLRRSKEQRDPTGKNWSPEDLYTLAQLCTRAQLYPEAARYGFALYRLPGNLPDGRSAQGAGLTGMISLLLTAPDQPIALGSGNLSVYRDIATLDQGPGFWNGILSLWLNSQDVPGQFAEEESKAQPYFHRSEAAALLKLLDQQVPSAPERPALHAQLIDVYATYGEDAALLREGERFFQTFPNAPERTGVTLAMADADARAKNTAAEFALYDRLLNDLGHATQNMPLSAAAAASNNVSPHKDTGTITASDPTADANPDSATAPSSEEAPADSGADTTTATNTPDTAHAFNLDTGDPTQSTIPAASAYAQVLDRYLGRLTATHQLPQALAVLRKELDRNPNDPKLYERLADFLAQNNLSAQQEEVYRAAIAKFDTPNNPADASWYDKLARFYLREKRRDAFATLTRQVTDIFSGTDLETYFRQVREGGPQLFLELNLYAHQRFPHDLVFTSNLLNAYTAKPTANHTAWEHLLRESWWQSPELTTKFFAFLSQTGQLDKELAQLDTTANPPTSPPNPAALTELAQAQLWQSHFEQSSPLFDQLAELYPTDPSLGAIAADLNRSLASLDPTGPNTRIAHAVGIEQHLLAANAADQTRLIRIGDILADHADASAASYAASAALWRRVPALAPGNREGYLEAATVFWDYFQFDSALDQLHLARTHFGDPALFGYEAGAILEGKRDLPGAVGEYLRAALAGSKSTRTAEPGENDTKVDSNLTSTPLFLTEVTADPAAERLLELARRPATASLVDTASAAALNATPTLPALRLRLAVLSAQHRKPEQNPLLTAAIERAATPDAAADLAAFAQKQGNSAAFQAALQREANLTPDPVEKLQLTYDLVRSYQSQNDRQTAQNLVDTTYRANPRLLGVVRFTVDFNWSNHREKAAIDTLLEAANAAHPKLAQQFTAEAASKANQSGSTTLARSLASTLLAADPYNPQFLSLAAESYTKANDNNGLEAFYKARLEAIHTAPMSAEERKTRTALLRRGLIPALIAARNYPAALDQYLALLSAFPEDNALIREAALFALRYSQQDKLGSFYGQTTRNSPRDARFFIALAQTDDIFGNPSGALDAYAHAVALRPERTDLYVAKAVIEERLQRFDAAVADYTRLFALSYKDPQWMVAAAQAQARQGHTAAAVQALETAYLHGTQTTPHDLFTVATQLDHWNLVPEAVTFAQRGAKLAGPDLLAGQLPAIDAGDPEAYARILTRARQTPEAFRRLHLALADLNDSPSSPSTVVAQVRSSGLASVTDAEWRRQYVHARQQRAQGQFTRAVLAISQTVATFGTPDDRAAYAAALADQKTGASPEDVAERWIPAAHAADLGDLEASWRTELLNSTTPPSARQLTPYIALQHARLRFADLGAALERFARMHPKSDRRAETVFQAAKAYAAAGQSAAELHLLSAQRLTDPSNASLRDTYLDLLAHHDTKTLVALAGSANEALADAALASTLAAAPPAVVLSAIHSRGVQQSPVWTAAYTGLAGLYLGDPSPAIDTAFRGALKPDATIAERLSSRPDTNQQLTSDLWFYNAARYGQWRLLSPTTQAEAEDLLPADLEQAPTLTNYLTLAQTEAEGGLLDQALVDTAHALELSPGSVEALDARAELLWTADRKQEATGCWRSALIALQSAEEKGPAPQSFWTGFERITLRVHRHALFAQLQPAMSELLRSYLRRNGTYRSNELLKAAFQSAPDEATGLGLILALSDAAPDPAQVLEDLATSFWLSTSAEAGLLSRELDLLQADSGGSADGNSLRLTEARSRLVRLLIESRQDARALALIQASPETTRSTPEFQQAALIAAARTGRLPLMLKTYEEPRAAAPEPAVVRSAAASLAKGSDWKDARTLLEWNFTRAETSHSLASNDFLNLAEARLGTQDTSGALEALHSLVTASQDRYTDEDAAASLLEEAHLQAEAIPFLAELSAVVPWELSYPVRLAEAELAAGSEVASATRGLTLVAKSGLAPYTLRARAARALASAHAAATDLGSPELNLLASGPVSPSLARQPFFVEARLASAAQIHDPATRLALLREAVAIAPYSGDSEKMRFEIFELTAHAEQTAFSRAVLDGMLAGQGAYTSPPQPSVRSGLLQFLDSNGVYMDSASSTPGPALPSYGQLLSKAEQATLAEEIADLYVATDDLAIARNYLLFARNALPVSAENGTTRTRLTSKLSSLHHKTRVTAANLARRPVVRKQLEQPVTVRVRLTTVPPDSILPTPLEEQ